MIFGEVRPFICNKGARFLQGYAKLNHSGHIYCHGDLVKWAKISIFSVSPDAIFHAGHFFREVLGHLILF